MFIQVGWGARDYREYVDLKQFLEVVDSEGVQRPFYLVKRDINYGAELSENVTSDDLVKIKTKFAVQKVAQEKQLTIYKLGSK